MQMLIQPLLAWLLRMSHRPKLLAKPSVHVRGDCEMAEIQPAEFTGDHQWNSLPEAGEVGQ